jgi:hypothetical protein
MEIKEDVRMCSFDIENTHTNITKLDTINVTTNILKFNSEIEENSQNTCKKNCDRTKLFSV